MLVTFGVSLMFDRVFLLSFIFFPSPTLFAFELDNEFELKIANDSVLLNCSTSLMNRVMKFNQPSTTFLTKQLSAAIYIAN